MRTQQQIESDIKRVNSKIQNLEDEIADLEIDLNAEEFERSELEKELFQLQTLNGNPIQVLYPLVPILQEKGTGHEIAIVEEAIAGELEDINEWGRIKHLARQFLHITL